MFYFFKYLLKMVRVYYRAEEGGVPSPQRLQQLQVAQPLLQHQPKSQSSASSSTSSVSASSSAKQLPIQSDSGSSGSQQQSKAVNKQAAPPSSQSPIAAKSSSSSNQTKPNRRRNFHCAKYQKKTGGNNQQQQQQQPQPQQQNSVQQATAEERNGANKPSSGTGSWLPRKLRGQSSATYGRFVSNPDVDCSNSSSYKGKHRNHSSSNTSSPTNTTGTSEDSTESEGDNKENNRPKGPVKILPSPKEKTCAGVTSKESCANSGSSGRSRRRQQSAKKEKPVSACPTEVKEEETLFTAMPIYDNVGFGPGAPGYIRRRCNFSPEEADMFSYLTSYVLPAHYLIPLGFPFECLQFPGFGLYYNYANIYSAMHELNRLQQSMKLMHFAYSNMYHIQNAIYDGYYRNAYSELQSVHYAKGGTTFYNKTSEKRCVRCCKDFKVDLNVGEYVTRERCIYHWGKLRKRFDTDPGTIYSCCFQGPTDGCTMSKVHVWNGTDIGLNGPHRGFIRTQPRFTDIDYDSCAYGLDCEMCYTAVGLEVTKVSLVNLKGKVVYDTFIKPENEVIDYNTRFSGVTEQQLNGCSKTLAQAQADLLQLIDDQTILIGHGLENDLRALKMVHTRVIDTSLLYPHARGFPYRQSLKTLASVVLNRDIHDDAAGGHDSIEDATTCIDLILTKVHRDGYNNDLLSRYGVENEFYVTLLATIKAAMSTTAFF